MRGIKEWLIKSESIAIFLATPLSCTLSIPAWAEDPIVSKDCSELKAIRDESTAALAAANMTFKMNCPDGWTNYFYTYSFFVKRWSRSDCEGVLSSLKTLASERDSAHRAYMSCLDSIASNSKAH
jgi:hypothetical protein